VKNAQVVAVMAIHSINQMADLDMMTDSQEPQVQQAHDEGQPSEVQKGTQIAAFQIEAMTFQIREHLLNPHASPIQVDCRSNSQLFMSLGQPRPTEPATTSWPMRAFFEQCDPVIRSMRGINRAS